jgi:hypothetical protein
MQRGHPPLKGINPEMIVAVGHTDRLDSDRCGRSINLRRSK